MLAAYAGHLEGCLLHDALASLWTFVGDANRFVDAEQPWALAKAAKGGDATDGDGTDRAAEAAARLGATLGDLLEACRLIGLAVAPYMPGVAPRVLAQLGWDYPYAADGNGGPPLAAELAWGAHAGEPGRLGSPVPLFPRLETEEGTGG